MSNQKYYWLKLKHDFFKRHDIRIVEDMPNGKDYVLFYLKLLVESVSHEGRLRFSDTIPYNDNMLATITNTNLDIVRAAMKIFTELKMIEILDDGTIYMVEVSGMIGSAANNDNAIRQQRFRDRKKNEQAPELPSVMNNNASVTKNVTNDNESIDIDKEIDKEIELDVKETKAKKTRFVPPTVDEVQEYCDERCNNVDAQHFVDYYTSNNWYVGRTKMVDWKAAVRTWERKSYSKPVTTFNVGTPYHTKGGNEFIQLLQDMGADDND